MEWNRNWKRIVLVPMDRIGDAVSDTPALAFLHAMGVEVIVLATPYTAQTFVNNPHVSRVIVFARAKRDGLVPAWTANHRAVNELVFLKPDAVLGMIRPIRELRGIYAALKIPVIEKQQDPGLPIYMRWVSFFNQLGLNAKPGRNEIFPSTADTVLVEQWLEAHGMDLRRPILVVHPGCAVYKAENAIRESLRYWSPDNFLAVFQGMPETYQIILTGVHPTEIAENTYIKEHCPRPTELFDLKNVRALAALIARATALLTLDTGTLHIGAATNTPIVAIFGPTTPDKYGPFSDNVTYVTAADPPPCWPCDHNTVCHGDNVCMHRLTPIQVVDAIKEVVR
jgi:ADP-heptose:LPS heptosyltransferase